MNITINWYQNHMYSYKKMTFLEIEYVNQLFNFFCFFKCFIFFVVHLLGELKYYIYTKIEN